MGRGEDSVAEEKLEKNHQPRVELGQGAVRGAEERAGLVESDERSVVDVSRRRAAEAGRQEQRHVQQGSAHHRALRHQNRHHAQRGEEERVHHLRGKQAVRSRQRVLRGYSGQEGWMVTFFRCDMGAAAHSSCSSPQKSPEVWEKHSLSD